MTVINYAPQQQYQQQPQQQYQQQPQQPQQQQRQTDPFWYRQNASYLYGVTNAPSNPQFGIEEISLKPASQAQRQYGILFNGLLRSIIGSISFQIRVSPRTQAPFVQTVSTENGVDQAGKKTYWEHIIIRPQIKAQILRFAEALLSGQAPVQQPQQQSYQQPYGQQQQYQPQQQLQQPQYQQQPAYGQQQQQFQQQPYGQQQQNPAYGQQPNPAYGQLAPAYTPPPAQDMNPEHKPEHEQPVSEQTPEEMIADIKEEDLPL